MCNNVGRDISIVVTGINLTKYDFVCHGFIVKEHKINTSVYLPSGNCLIYIINIYKIFLIDCQNLLDILIFHYNIRFRIHI